MVTGPQTLIYAIDDDPETENKKLQFWGKSSHNVKILVDLGSSYQGLSYDVLHDMVPYGTVKLRI
jgi:hypothetical protein